MVSVAQISQSHIWPLLTGDLFARWCIGWRLYRLMYWLNCQDFCVGPVLSTVSLRLHLSTKADLPCCPPYISGCSIHIIVMRWKTLLFLLHLHAEFPFTGEWFGRQWWSYPVYSEVLEGCCHVSVSWDLWLCPAVLWDMLCRVNLFTFHHFQTL